MVNFQLLVVLAAIVALALAAPEARPQIYSSVVSPGVYSAGWVSPYAYAPVAYV
jgi:hypothetical protein